MVSLKHKFVTGLPDDPFASSTGEVQPQRDWNDEHVLLQGPLSFLGRPDSVPGLAPTVEIPFSGLAALLPFLPLTGGTLTGPLFATGVVLLPTPGLGNEKEGGQLDWKSGSDPTCLHDLSTDLFQDTWRGYATRKSDEFISILWSMNLDGTGVEFVMPLVVDGRITAHTPPYTETTTAVVTADWVLHALSTIGGGSPTGPAGGVLANSYPNPGFAPHPVFQNGLDITGTGFPGWHLIDTAQPSGKKNWVGYTYNGDFYIEADSDDWNTTIAYYLFGHNGVMELGASPPPAAFELEVVTAAWVLGKGYLTSGSIPTSLPPSGTAGGALSGTYPSPGLAWISRTASQTLAIGTGGTLGSNAFTSTAFQPAGSYQTADAALTALSGLAATAGILEQTSADVFAIRLIGTAAGSSIPTTALADARYAPISHTHTSLQITDWNEAVDDRVAALLVAGTNITLTYNDVANTLQIAASGGGAATVVGVTPPGSPTDGQLWYDSDAAAGGGQLYIYYNDGTSSAWVPATPSSTGSLPTGPAGGDLLGTYPNPTLNPAVIAVIPQNSQSATYPLVLADAGRHVYHPVAAAAAIYTIPANASVAYPIGTTLTFVNDSANVVTISITSDVLVWSPGTTTGSRSLAVGGMATALKVTATRWLISGTGLS